MKENSYKWFNLAQAAEYLSISQSEMCDLWRQRKIHFFFKLLASCCDRTFEEYDLKGDMRRYCYKKDLDNYKESKK